MLALLEIKGTRRRKRLLKVSDAWRDVKAMEKKKRATPEELVP